MKLSNFPQNTLDVVLHDEYEGVTLKVSQEASVGDMALILEVASMERPPLRQTAEAIARLIVSWNMEEEDGSPMPVTQENIER